MFASVKMIEILAKTNCKLSELVSKLPKFYTNVLEVACPFAERGKVMRSLLEEYSNRKIDSDSVINHGFLDHALLPEKYNAASVFVSPSRFEGGGLTLLEAMACGTPILGSKTGYGIEIAQMVPEFIADTMAEFFAKQFILTQDREHFGELANSIFWQHFSPEQFERNWVHLVENI